MGKFYINNISEVILEKLNIIDVVSPYVELKRTGSNYKGLCPFHSEKTPSFVVSEDKQLYHCFGCGASGNAIGFIMNIENLDFIDSIELLADKLNLDLSQYENKKDKFSGYDEKKDIYRVLRSAAILYYKNLRKEKLALEYLKNRSVNYDYIKEFGIGYAKDDWSFLLNNFPKKDIKYLEKAGLILKNKNGGYYDRFRNRVIFPIINVQGKVIGFGGRVLDNSLPKYLNSPETIVFNKSKTLYGLNIAKNNLGENRSIIVVEGYMDVVSLNIHGVKNVVATLGTSLTKEHGKLLSRYADEIIICYDGDIAGKKAAIRSIEVLKDIKSKVKILNIENGYDPDDYIKEYGKEKFINLLNTSKVSLDYVFELYKSDYDIDKEDGLLDYIKSCIKFLSKYNDNVVHDVYIKKISNETNIDISTLKKELKKELSSRYDRDVVDIPSKKDLESKVRQKFFLKDANLKKLYQVEVRILEYALKDKMYFDKILDFGIIENIFNSNVKDTLFNLGRYYESYANFKINNAIDSGYFDLEILKKIELILNKSILDESLITSENRAFNKILNQHLKFSLELKMKNNQTELLKVIKEINNLENNPNDIKNKKEELEERKKTLNNTIRSLVRKINEIKL